MCNFLDLAKGGLGAEDATDNSSITYVAEDAVSGFGEYEYDYYDEEEVETEPKPEENVEPNPKPVSEANNDGSGGQLSENKNDGTIYKAHK